MENISEKGIYILKLKLTKDMIISIGKLGNYSFKRGVYLYVGSAFGPGGISGRLKHHRDKNARQHWHIDYLNRNCALKDIFYFCTPAKSFEHKTALLLSAVFCEPVKGFGSSDCSCFSHLFYSPTDCSGEDIIRITKLGFNPYL